MWTKARVNETKTKLKRQDRSVLKTTFKILLNNFKAMKLTCTLIRKTALNVQELVQTKT